MPPTREYEVLYILAPDLDEDGQKKMMDAVVGVIEKTGAEILKNDIWGRRKLAYSIKKHTEGIYVLVRCNATSSMPKELDVFIKRTPEILRHLTTLVTKQQLKEEARQRSLEAKRMKKRPNEKPRRRREQKKPLRKKRKKPLRRKQMRLLPRKRIPVLSRRIPSRSPKARMLPKQGWPKRNPPNKIA